MQGVEQFLLDAGRNHDNLFPRCASPHERVAEYEGTRRIRVVCGQGDPSLGRSIYGKTT